MFVDQALKRRSLAPTSWMQDRAAIESILAGVARGDEQAIRDLQHALRPGLLFLLRRHALAQTGIDTVLQLVISAIQTGTVTDATSVVRLARSLALANGSPAAEALDDPPIDPVDLEALRDAISDRRHRPRQA